MLRIAIFFIILSPLPSDRCAGHLSHMVRLLIPNYDSRAWLAILPLLLC